MTYKRQLLRLLAPCLCGVFCVTSALAQTPGELPYGWWYSKKPVAAGHPSGITAADAKPEKNKKTDSASTQPDAQPGAHPETGGKPADKAKQNASGEGETPASHAFARNSSTTQSFYLGVSKGADMPSEAPEVYYRFTVRTMERHGGVPVSSSTYKAKVEKDRNTWRVDVYSPEYGSAEVFSRFRIGEKYVYSQFNYLHYFRVDDKNAENGEGKKEPAPMPPAAAIPEDWPTVTFPASSYNEMPFRGLRLGASEVFTVEPGPARSVPPAAKVAEDNFEEPLSIAYDPESRGFSYAPREDGVLEASPPRTSKTAVVIVEFPESGEISTFSLTVSKSKWSGLDLNSGLVLLFGTAVTVTAIVLYRRRRFKYHDRN